MSPILQSFLGRRRRLETYNSLFGNDDEMGTWVGCLGLMVVDEFPDVFLNDLPILPPDKEIKFDINLVPGAQSISIAPYIMASAKLTELQRQHDKLLEKGFIRSSTSP